MSEAPTPRGHAERPALRALAMDDVTARRVLLLAAGMAASTLFTFVDYTPLRFVAVPTRVAVLLLVAAAVIVAGVWLRRTVVVIAVGAILTLLGLMRLLTYGYGSGLIGGQASTAALLTALGVAVVVVAVARR